MTRALERWGAITVVTPWPLCALCGCLLKNYPQFLTVLIGWSGLCSWAKEEGLYLPLPSITFHPSMHFSQWAKPDIRPHLSIWTCSTGPWVTLQPQRF